MTRMSLQMLLCLLLAASTAGCEETKKSPDSGPQVRKLAVVAGYGPDVGLLPGASSLLRVRYSGGTGAAITGAEVRFAIFGDPHGSTLSADRANTGAGGEAAITMRAGAEAARFQVRATADGGAAATFYVEVSDKGFGSLSISGKYTGTRPRLQLVTVTYFLLPGGACAKLDPLSPTGVLRTRTVSGLEAAVIFTAISLGSARAVAARAADSKAVATAAGCVEVPASVLTPGQTLSMGVELRDLPPRTAGSYTITSTLTLPAGTTSAPIWPRPLADALAPWGGLTDCKHDPAQALLDCVVDALDAGDPLDCVVIKPGAKASSIQAERGSLTGGCRGETTERGTTSLEKSLYERMAQKDKALLTALGKVEADARALLTTLRIGSTLTLTALDSGGLAVARHELVSVGLGNAGSPASYLAANLALAARAADPVKATVKSWHLSLAKHELSLRLGAIGRQGLADAVLDPAKLPKKSLALVKKVAGLVQASVGGKTVTGCPALEHQVCTAARLGAGCLGNNTCDEALAALAAKLDAGFTRIDQHKAADLTWSAEAALADSDGDLKVDTVGTKTVPGLWTATLRLYDETVKPGEAVFTGKR